MSAPRRAAALFLALASAALGQEAGRPFDHVRGWNVLTWDMDVEEARTALAGAGIDAQEKQDVRHGTMRLHFVHEGWKGVVYFDAGDADDAMSQILLENPPFVEGDDEPAEEMVHEFVVRFGAPHEARRVQIAGTERVEEVSAWWNPWTELSVTLTRDPGDAAEPYAVWVKAVPLPDERVVRAKPALEAADDRLVRVEGRYDVVDVAPYTSGELGPDGQVVKSTRAAFLGLADGTRVRLGMRPTAELDGLPGKDVSVVGRVVLSPERAPEHVAQPDPAPALEVLEVSTAGD